MKRELIILLAIFVMTVTLGNEAAKRQHTLHWIVSDKYTVRANLQQMEELGIKPRIIKGTEVKAEDFNAELIMINCDVNMTVSAETLQTNILPALNNGAVIVFSSFGAPSIEKYLNDPELRTGFSYSGLPQVRKTSFITDNNIVKIPHDLTIRLKSGSAPPCVFHPVNPDRWLIIAGQPSTDKSGTTKDEPYLMAMPIGKGLIVVGGVLQDTYGGTDIGRLFGNLIEFNRSRQNSKVTE